MLNYKIPGRGKFEIENIVLDYNGTVAVDGLILDGVKELLSKLKEHANVYILTADTYGTVREECKDLGVEVIRFPNENAGENKKRIVKELNGQKTICIGNGYNDIPMFEESILSIAVIEGEGACGKLLSNSDIVTRSIIDALNIILNEKKLAATLRN
ncbi:MAG: HAD family hydrolase [Tissierellia bacterium]|nr:HAD family hydrolase [Tissierellia bacterium]MDD4726683.1 HAD family hydrolase [Tissierellia bacterium]